MIVYEAMHLPHYESAELLGVWGTLSEAQAACNRHENRNYDTERSVDFDDEIAVTELSRWPHHLNSSDRDTARAVTLLQRGDQGSYEIIGYTIDTAEIQREQRLDMHVMDEESKALIARLSQLQAEINAMLAKLPPPTDQPDEMLKRALWGDE